MADISLDGAAKGTGIGRRLGLVAERIVWPLSLLYWGRTWTVGAWCELRQAFRSFRIDRIASSRTLGSRFPDEAGKRLQDYFAAVRDGDC